MFITANKYFVAFFIVFSEHSSNKLIKHVVHKNVVGGSSIIWVFPLVIADSGLQEVKIQSVPVCCIIEL